MKSKPELIELIQKYNSGSCSADEKALLESWYASFELTGNADLTEAQLEEIYAMQPAIDSVPKRLKIWPRIAIAAAAVVAITLGTWLYVNEIASSRKASRNDEVVMNDIKPGSVGATLTLANGKTIKLSDATNGELAKQAGVTISKSANGQLVYEVKPTKGTSDDLGAINTLSTAKGETYQVKLPDGTAVWLNAASSLKYAANLLQYGKRKVTLQGEAFFQVAKDKKHPFIVESKGQQVEVLGTHFNIDAYADEGTTKTTLLEGSVSVSSFRGKHSDTETSSAQAGAIPQGEAVKLKPNQQAILMANKQIQVKQVDPAAIIDWKNGDFSLNDLDFKTAMRKLSRWYDIEVIYDDSVPLDIEAGGWISRNSNLSSVLKLIENSGQVRFKVEGKKVYVYK